MISAALFLVMFGIAFDAWVGGLGDRKRGYTALLVVVGVVVTLSGVALISWRAALLCAAAFIFSGLPMIAGDIRREVKARELAIRSQQAQVHDLDAEITKGIGGE